MTIQYDNLNTTISAVGSATDIPVNIQTKGTGGLNLLGSGQNLLTQSAPINSSPWLVYSLGGATNPTVTYNTTDVTDPLGTNKAAKVVTLGTTISQASVFGNGAFTTIGATYTASVYLRGAVGGEVVYIMMEDNITFSVQACTLTTAWQRFSVTASRAAGLANYFVIGGWGTGASGGTPATSACTYYVWGAQLELASSVGTYVATTTTAIYGTPTLTLSGVAGVGLQSDGSLYVQPAGTGAIQAQPTTSTTVGGNARGQNAVDWQTSRTAATQVASGSYAVIGGGYSHTANNLGSTVAGGYLNTNTSFAGSIGGGQNNTASGGYYSALVGGYANNSTGSFNFIGGGSNNSGTASAAVTTQSGTMNGTTAVTLSGSNANIKVGQLILGASIASYSYVAAVSGTSLTLSQAATGSSTSTLSFFTPHGVVVGGGNNQATGSYSFIGGGGDAGTAANRNVASGDWSFVGGGWANTASGSGSFVGGGGVTSANTVLGNTSSGISSVISGGYGNVSSSTSSTVGGGNNNTASGPRSTVVGGTYATTRGISGNTILGTSERSIASVTGVSQAGLLILGRQTTDATPTALTSTSVAAGTTNQVILPNNSAYFFTGEVVSGVTGGGDTKGWTIEGVIKRGANAASTALVGTPTVTSNYADAGASTWTIAVTADTTNGGLAVTFTGQASTTIRTVAQIRTTEMTY